MNQYSRTRARETKPASGAVFQGTGVRKTKAPKGVTVEKRLQEFPAETFCKSAGVLFCRACTREVSLIKQTIVTHVKSEAHEALRVAPALSAAPRVAPTLALLASHSSTALIAGQQPPRSIIVEPAILTLARRSLYSRSVPWLLTATPD